MYLWLIIAIGAYLLYAVNGVADKFLLSKVVKHPIAYAFYIGITGPLTLLLAPFGFRFISLPDFFVAVIGGACFPVALFFLYKAIQQTSISRILPIEGGLVPIWTLALAYLILGERLTNFQLFAFLFLVAGAVLISFKKQHGQWHALALGNALIASFLFAFSLTIEKYIFHQSNFVSGLIWTRMGFFLASVSFLIPKKARRYITNAPKETSTGNKFLYYGTRVTGGLAGLMQNYAISLGSVTLVNALQGTQYMFLLILTSILSLRYPKILKEHISGQTVSLKVISIIIISVGLFLLAK